MALAGMPHSLYSWLLILSGKATVLKNQGQGQQSTKKDSLCQTGQS